MQTHTPFSSAIRAFLDGVRQFVRTSLGCECPDEVFDQVRVLRGENVPGSAELALVVGERLLVLFAGDCPQDDLGPWLCELLQSGREYRDINGLNRFRLVLTEAAARGQHHLIKEISGQSDDRVHVHVL